MAVKSQQAASLERVSAALEEFAAECNLYQRYTRTDDAQGVNLSRSHKLPPITSPGHDLFYVGKSNAMGKEELFAYLRGEMEKNADPKP